MKQQKGTTGRRRFLELAKDLVIGGIGLAIGAAIGYQLPRQQKQKIEEPDELSVDNFNFAKKVESSEGADLIISNERTWELFALKYAEGGYPKHEIDSIDPDAKGIGLDVSRGSIVYAQTPLSIGNYSTLSYRFKASKDPAHVRLYFNGELLRSYPQQLEGILEYDISKYRNRVGIFRVQAQGLDERHTNSKVLIGDIKLRKTPRYSGPKV